MSQFQPPNQPPQYPSQPEQPPQYPYSQPQPQYTPPPVQPLPKKKMSLGKFFAIGCGGLAALVILIIVIVAVAGAESNAANTASQATQGAQATQAVQPTQPPAQPTAVPTQAPTVSPAVLEATYKASTTDTTVANLDKDGAADQGKDVHFTATILNFVKDSSGTTAGANVDDPNSSGVVQIAFPTGTDISQLNTGDTLEVWGLDGGTASGTNAFGATIQEVVVSALYLTDKTTGYQAG